MKHLSTIILITLLVLCYCTNRDEKLIETKLLDGRHVRVPYIVNNGNTILNGIGRYYSSEKELIDEYEFKNSKRNGWHYHYSSGKLFSKIWFVNDSANGKGLFYNEKGKVHRENFYYKDKVILSKFYYPNGSVDLINFYDNDLPFYAITYDSLGKKISESGMIISPNFYSNQNLDSIKVNKPLQLRFPIVSLPGYFTTIEVAKFNAKEDVYDVTDSVPVQGYFAIYSTSFDEQGARMLGIAGELKDSNGKIIKRDTIYRKINVVK